MSRKSASKRSLELHLHRLPVAVLDAQPLVEPAVNKAGSPDAETLAGDHRTAGTLQLWIDQLEGGDIGAVDAVAEQDRLPAVEADFEGGQEAGVRAVEAVAEFAGRGEVPVQVGDDEDLVFLQDHSVFQHSD